ncbi:protein POLR1D [Centroberyx affinis]|uniref:protein POLR1D n=1 Tax=Centroberyx affinis TaxID=166261 RepID=UPI003A5C7136
MADEGELEKRAVEELLRETSRARVRAETMGPAGWMKCPLRSTNKRFLLNTLRSTGLQRRSTGPGAGQSTTRGRLRSESQSRDRSRSRTPPRDHRANGGHTEQKYHHRDGGDNDKRHDRDRSHRHKDKDNRDQRHRKDVQNRDSDTHRFDKDLSPGEAHSSSGEYGRSHHSCPLTGRHAPQSCRQVDRSCSRSPVGHAHSGRSQK